METGMSYLDDMDASLSQSLDRVCTHDQQERLNTVSDLNVAYVSYP